MEHIDIKVFFKTLSQMESNHREIRQKIDTVSKAPISLGLTVERYPYVMVEYHSPEVLDIQSCVGFDVILPDDYRYNDSSLRVVSSNETNRDLFFVVAQNLVDTVIDLEYGAIEAFIEKLKVWLKFFRTTRDGILTLKEQVGLFGELLFIESLLQEGFFNVIDSWKGPLAAAKDFIIDDKAVEVKTSVMSDKNLIHISDEYQLDASGYDSLYLELFMIYEDRLNGRNIPELAADIEYMLKDDATRLKLFKDLLFELGYSPKFSHKYQNYFSMSYEYTMKVEGDFPKLTAGVLPAGISRVSYSVNLENCMPYVIKKDSLVSMFKGENA